MLVTLLIWLYILLVLAGWGLLFARLSRRLLRAGEAAQLPLPILVLVGFAAATTAASLISLFAPTGLLTSLVLLSGAAAGLYPALRGRTLGAWVRGARAGLAPLILLLAAVTFVYVLNAATLKTANPDTGIYHAQAVHWIESYPAVPGLGNLHTRLAYNSAWFVTNAAFSLAFLGGRSFHLVSGLLFLAALAYFLGGITDLLRGRTHPAALLKTALFPLSTYLLARDISSPAPDLPAVLLVWVCVGLYIEIVIASQTAAGTHDLRLHDTVLALLALFAVTVKLSALPVLLLPALRLFGRGRRFTFVLVGLAATVLLPWLARNLVLSGYPVFPGPALDLFRFDWRIPAQVARDESLGITLWARLSRLPAAEVRAMPLQVWSRLWFNNLTANRQLLFLAALFSPAAMLLSLLAGLSARRSSGLLHTAARVFPAWASAWVGVLFWFLSAPALRFGYGFLVTAALLAVLPLLNTAAGWVASRIPIAAVVLAVLLLAYQGLVLAQSLDAPTLPDRLALPTDYTDLPTEPCRTGHLSLTCPSQWQECGYKAFPCTPSLNPRVVPRGLSLRDGYRSLDVP